MKETVPPNPYHGADLQALYDACQARAGELMRRDGAPRTPEQREALALDTAHLLLAVAGTLVARDIASLSTLWPGERKQVVAAFLPKHEEALRSARYRTLVGAADAVLGGARANWIRDARVDAERAYDLALGSEEGLLRVLDHLQQLATKSHGASAAHGASKPARRSGPGR